MAILDDLFGMGSGQMAGGVPDEEALRAALLKLVSQGQGPAPDLANQSTAARVASTSLSLPEPAQRAAADVPALTTGSAYTTDGPAPEPVRRAPTAQQVSLARQPQRDAQPGTPFQPTFAQRMAAFGKTLAGDSVLDLDEQALARNETYGALVKRGLDPETAKMAVRNPTVLQAILPQIFGGKKLMNVNGRLVNEATGDLVADYSDGNKPIVIPAGGTLASAGGKPLMTAPKEMATADKKEIWDAEDTRANLGGTLDALTAAKKLNADTFSGIGASTAGFVGTRVPIIGSMVPQKGAKATAEWEQIMSPAALETMANTLKGATTDFELRKYIDILAAPGQSIEIRERTLDRMMQLVEVKRKMLADRISNIQGGAYQRPGAAGAGPAPAPPVGDASGALAKAREAIARGADRSAVLQRLRDNGIDAAGL